MFDEFLEAAEHALYWHDEAIKLGDFTGAALWRREFSNFMLVLTRLAMGKPTEVII